MTTPSQFVAANPSRAASSVLPTDKILLDRGGQSFVADAKAMAQLGFVYPEDYFLGSVPAGWLAAMVSAGVKKIALSSQTYPYPLTSSTADITASDISIVGTSAPIVDENNLVPNGSIIQGGVGFLGANNVLIQGVFIDSSDSYSGTRYSGGGLIFTGGKNISVETCTVLMSSSSIEHAFLSQGSDFVRVVRCCVKNSTHGFAIKSRNVHMDDTKAIASGTGVTIKTDTLAAGTGFQSENVFIGSHVSKECVIGAALVTGGDDAASLSLRNIVINELNVIRSIYDSGVNSTGVSFDGQSVAGDATSISIASLNLRNVKFGVYGNTSVAINTAAISRISHSTGSRTGVFQFAATGGALSIGEVCASDVTSLFQLGTNGNLIVGSVAMKNGNNIFNTIDATAKAKLGSFSCSSGVASFPSDFSLLNSCTNYSGNAVRISRLGGASQIDGWLVPPDTSAHTDYQVLQLPAWMYPPVQKVVSINLISGGAYSLGIATISTTGVVAIKSIPANTTAVIFDGVSWQDLK